MASQAHTPKQEAALTAVPDASTVGSVTTNNETAVHPLAASTVTVKVPSQVPVAVAVVWLGVLSNGSVEAPVRPVDVQ